MIMRRAFLAALAVLMLGVVPARAGVAILGAPNDPSWNDDVQAKILASGVPLGVVDVYNVANSTPSLATLQGYDAVLVYTDGVFDQAGPLGDVLADYVDSGGGVVEMVFATASIPLGGRWASDGYAAITPESQAQGANLTLGTVFDPGHPLFDGVSSFDGGASSYHGTGAVAPGATLLANWSNGEAFAAERDDFNGTILALNFFPPSSDVRADFWLASTDGGLLMANALAYVGGAAAAVPEPATLASAGLGGLVLGLAAFRRRARTRTGRAA